jgi:hypothetical protein
MTTKLVLQKILKELHTQQRKNKNSRKNKFQEMSRLIHENWERIKHIQLGKLAIS